MSPKAHNLMIPSHRTQVIIFERDGRTLDSCHTLFNVSEWIGNSLYSIEPCLGSMGTIIVNLETDQDPIHLPGVERWIDGDRRYTDYYIYANPENTNTLVWLIVDLTMEYRDLKKVQQKRNELLLTLESIAN